MLNLNMGRVHEKNKRAVQIGDMIFDSVNQAAKHVKLSGPSVGKYIREKKLINGMVGKYLSKAEYKEKLLENAKASV